MWPTTAGPAKLMTHGNIDNRFSWLHCDVRVRDGQGNGEWIFTVLIVFWVAARFVWIAFVQEITEDMTVSKFHTSHPPYVLFALVLFLLVPLFLP